MWSTSALCGSTQHAQHAHTAHLTCVLGIPASTLMLTYKPRPQVALGVGTKLSETRRSSKVGLHKWVTKSCVQPQPTGDAADAAVFTPKHIEEVPGSSAAAGKVRTDVDDLQAYATEHTTASTSSSDRIVPQLLPHVTCKGALRVTLTATGRTTGFRRACHTAACSWATVCRLFAILAGSPAHF